MVDLGRGRRKGEILVPHYVSVVPLQVLVEVVEAELHEGRKDVEAAREDQVRVLVAKDAASLEIHIFGR